MVDEAPKSRAVKADDREKEISRREATILTGLRTLKWLVAVLIVISAGNFVRSFYNQEAADKSTDASEQAEDAADRIGEVATEGRDASVDTLNELRVILAEIEANQADQPELNNQLIVDSLKSIARMENFLCGGPCPEPGG